MAPTEPHVKVDKIQRGRKSGPGKGVLPDEADSKLPAAASTTSRAARPAEMPPPAAQSLAEHVSTATGAEAEDEAAAAVIVCFFCLRIVFS